MRRWVGVPKFGSIAWSRTTSQFSAKLKGKPADFARKAAQEFNDKAYHSPQDELRSIYDRYTDVAMLSKFAGGIGLFPANTVPQFVGAWFGRKYMARRYGEQNWAKYAPVLLAGFSCGTGLMSLMSIALALIAKAVAKLPY